MKIGEIGSEQVILPIAVDAEIVEFMNEQKFNYKHFLAGVLKAYVESQQKSGV